MPYVKRTITAGRTKEIEYYFTSRYNKPGVNRSDRIKATKEEQIKINNKQAIRKLRILINANFIPNDYHIVLSYKREPGEDYRTPEEMKQDISKFLRSLRKEYKKQGKELKYVQVAEVGTRGARHQHIVINKIDTEIVQAAWQHGRIRVMPLDDSGQYAKLASYLLKYTSSTIGTEQEIQAKRWNCSRNLVRPKAKYQIVTKPAYFKTDARAPKGWYVDQDSIDIGLDKPDFYGFGYFRYTIIKLKGA